MKNTELYSIQFLHQITTLQMNKKEMICCIVSNFYIKSQQATLILIA